MPQDSQYTRQPERRTSLRPRSLLHFAIISAVLLVLSLLLSQWRFHAYQQSLAVQLQGQREAMMSRNGALLELDKLLMRGAILSNYEQSLVTGGESLEALKRQLRGSQRLLAKPIFSYWRSGGGADQISALHRILDLYLSVDAMPSSMLSTSPLNPASDQKILLSLLQDLHLIQVASLDRLNDDSRHYELAVADYRIIQNTLLVLLALPGCVIVIASLRWLRLRRTISVRRREIDQLFYRLPEASLLVDRQGRVVAASQAVFGLLDYTPGALKDTDVYALLPNRFLRHVQQYLDALWQADEVFGVASREFVLLDRCGRERPIEIHSSRVSISGRSLVVLSLRNQAPLHLLHQQNQVSEKRFAMAVAATRDGLWDWDVVAGSVYFSERWCQMLGVESGTPWEAQKAIGAFVIEGELKQITKVIRRFLASGKTQFRLDHQLRCRDGSIVDVICRACAERDATGRVTRVVGTHSDVTELRRREQESFQLNRRLETLLQQRAELLPPPMAASHTGLVEVLGHEIRTPMNGIVGMSDLLDKTFLDTDQRMMLDTIRDSSRSLLVILDDLLDFAALESNTLTLQWQRVDLRQFLEDLVAGYSAELTTGDQHLILHPAVDLPIAVECDPHRLHQLLRKLLDNALKFSRHSKPYSVVHLWAGLSEAGPKAGSSCEVEFKVWDNGIGIAEEKQSALFQAFSQLDSGRNRRFGGSGLGLAIVTRLVKLLDGETRLRSQSGQFTEVVVTLPMTVLSHCAPAGAGDSLVVLQIADVKLALSVKDILSAAGYRVFNGLGAPTLRALHNSPEQMDWFLVQDTETGTPVPEALYKGLSRIYLENRPKGEQRPAVENRVFKNPLLPSALLSCLRQGELVKL